eukprot:scaffold2098_cov75-Cylindrotheca_fusiformis.AAC.2
MQHHEEEKAYWIYNGQQDKVPATVRRVKIADNVTKIPDMAFHGHQLEEVILSSSVQVIGKDAFYYCTKLKSILYHQSLDGDNGDEEKQEDAIPSNVRGVIERGCILLARLGLKEGLERIEFEAFTRCESLTEVDIPSTVQVIDDWVFGSCKLLARLVLKEGRLERIGSYAFDSCESLTEVDIPSTVQVIDDHAFQRCRRLARLSLKEGRLERIGSFAFKECDSLSHVRIPRSVSSLATAFVKCSNLISMERPEECSFGMIALSGCQSLVSLAGGQIAFSAAERE